MRITELTVYTFDELSDDAKEKAIETWVQNDDLPFLSDDIHEHLGTLLAEYKFKCDNAHVFYDLGYSQGDGAMFTGDVSYKGYTFTVEHYGHYYHYNSKQITAIERNNGNQITDATWSKMFNEFEPLYVELCKKLEAYGYDHIESEHDAANVSENLIANDYEFYEDGTFYYDK